MRFRTLGKTGLQTSIIGLGTWQLGGEWGVDFSQPAADAILDAAADAGVNFIDTAECYGPDHISERLVGDYLARHDRSAGGEMLRQLLEGLARRWGYS